MVVRRAMPRRRLGGVTVSREINDILQRGADGGRITPEEALLLYTEAPLHALGQAADAVRRRRYPDNIATYIIDRNINYTNVCVTACKFCAFYRAAQVTPRAGPTRSRRSCAAAARRSSSAPPRSCCRAATTRTTACECYEQPFSAIKRGVPAAGPALARRRPRSCTWPRSPACAIDEAIAPDQGGRAGLASPAPAPRSCSERPRTAIAPLKESGERWLEVMETAHGLGLESTATFMMGTGETNAERIEHLRDDPRRAGPHRRLPRVHPVDLPAGEQPPQGPHPGDHAWSTCG